MGTKEEPFFRRFRGACAELKTIAKRSKSNKFNYVDLPDVIDTIKPVLDKHGIMFYQVLKSDGDRRLIETNLFDDDGVHLTSSLEFIEAMLHGAEGNNPVQRFGSAATYLRRYTLLTILGIAPQAEDDDGDVCVNEKSFTSVPPVSRVIAQPAPTPLLSVDSIVQQLNESTTVDALKQVYASYYQQNGVSTFTPAEQQRVNSAFSTRKSVILSETPN